MLNLLADEESVFRLLDPVVRAPSVHNIQPWWFRIEADDRIDLCGRFGGSPAETEGSRRPADPVPAALLREEYISCGAALYNLRLAFRVTGHDVAVWMLPYGPDSPVLASVEIALNRTKRTTVTEQELYDAIPRRHTNRWPYDRHPVPPNLLAAMQAAASQEQGRLRLLHRRQVRTWLHEAQAADRTLRAQHGYQPDADQWTCDDASDLVTHEHHPQLLVLSTRHDMPADWLHAGQALQHALLAGTCYGVSASFLTQPLELHDALPGQYSGPRRLPWRWPFPEYPQLVLRVGFATHDPVCTQREDPEVLDARTGRWLHAPSRTVWPATRVLAH